jgi:hypothetical protein
MEKPKKLGLKNSSLQCCKTAELILLKSEINNSVLEELQRSGESELGLIQDHGNQNDGYFDYYLDFSRYPRYSKREQFMFKYFNKKPLTPKQQKVKHLNIKQNAIKFSPEERSCVFDDSLIYNETNKMRIITTKEKEEERKLLNKKHNHDNNHDYNIKCTNKIDKLILESQLRDCNQDCNYNSKIRLINPLYTVEKEEESLDSFLASNQNDNITITASSESLYGDNNKMNNLNVLNHNSNKEKHL